MTQQRKGSSIQKLKEMKSFKMPISEMLEVKQGLILLTKNDKIPIQHIMSLNEIKQELQPHLTSYSEANDILEKRLAEKTADTEGTIVDAIPGDKTLELLEGKRVLLKKEYDVKLPVFTIIDLGYDTKKPTANKYGIPTGAILALGRLVTRGK